MLLLSFIFAHLIADFYLQTNKMVENKKKYIALHMIHHFICLSFVVFIFWWVRFDFQNVFTYAIFPIIFLLSTHLFIDLGKIHIENSKMLKKYRKPSFDLLIFLLDQLLHMVFLIITCIWFYDDSLSIMYRKIKSLLLTNDTMNFPANLIFIAIVFIVTTTVCGHIISKILGNLSLAISTFEGKYAFKNEINDDRINKKRSNNQGMTEEYSFMIVNKDNLNRGRMIGYIERLLVLILTYYSSFSAIAFIITAKSITRFKQMDDRNFAEYFLLGTLLSILFGIMIGLFVKAIIH